MPLSTVVVPARGRAELLVRVLQLLDDQSSDDYEIVVVSDRCGDSSRAVADLALRHACRLYELPGGNTTDEEHAFGAAAARNLGARFAYGELLIFLDADCLVARDHVAGFVAAFEPETLLLGPIDYVDEADPTKLVRTEIRPPLVGETPPPGVDPQTFLASHCWTGNLAVGRREFRALGGFDLDFHGKGGEDVDFGLRFVARHGRVARGPSRVRHVGATAAFAHARGEPGPLDNGLLEERLRAGRYREAGARLEANGGLVWFDDPSRWRDVRDLRAGGEEAAPSIAEDLADTVWTGTGMFQVQLERSAAALVAIARLLDRKRPLGGAEQEFLDLYARVVKMDPAAFSQVWSDPQAYAWVKATFERVESAVGESRAADAHRRLAEQLERFKPFALLCAYHAGERLELARPFPCPEELALPGTRFSLQAAAGSELRGADGSGLELAAVQAGDAAEPFALPLREDAPAAPTGARLTAAPVIAWQGREIRLQPAIYHAARRETADLVRDPGHDYQAEHVGVLGEALGLVERFSPDAAELAEWLQVIAFNRPGTTSYGNTASSELPGAILLTSTHDPVQLSELLVHELHHLRLFAMELEGPLFEDAEQNAATDAFYYSPWRDDPRPIKGLLHSVYVFVAVLRHYFAMAEGAGPDEEHIGRYGRAAVAKIALQVPTAVRSLKENARFSHLGRRIAEVLFADFEDLRRRAAAAGIDGRATPVAEEIEAHADWFDPARIVERVRSEMTFTAKAAVPREAGRPRISCLCVTRRRSALLARAVRCFLAQTWLDRELVIVHEQDDAETAACVADLAASRADILSVCVPRRPDTTLGALRNLAAVHATGEYVCQWDDDDWHHPERLEAQWRALAGSPEHAASVLSRWTLFDQAAGRAYLSPERAWEGSLLCRRAALPAYPNMSNAEDTPVVDALRSAGRLVGLSRPELYVYVCHGANTWAPDHFAGFFHESLRLGPRLEREIAELLAKGAA